MYQTGEYVMNSNSGICKIEGTTHLDIPGIDEERLYYICLMQSDGKTRQYVPVDMEDRWLRSLITKEQAESILERAGQIEMIAVPDDKKRELKYKEALNSGDPEKIVSIIKCIYDRKKKRYAMGKKNTATDEKYLRMAEETLYAELNFAAGMEIEEIRSLISQCIE